MKGDMLIKLGKTIVERKGRSVKNMYENNIKNADGLEK